MNLLQQRILGAGNRVHWRAADLGRIAKRFGVGLSAMPVLATPRFVAPPGDLPATVLRGNGDGKSYTFTISTASVDRMGDTIAVGGWKLAAYRKNPIVLFGHASEMLPVGRAGDVFPAGGRLKATMEFSDDRFAQRVKAQVDSGDLRATSVGFIPIRWDFTRDPNRELGIDFLEQELLEFSIVPIPANAGCLIEAGNSAKSASTAPTRNRDEAREFLAAVNAPRGREAARAEVARLRGLT